MNQDKIWHLVQEIKNKGMKEKDLSACFSEELKELSLSEKEVIQFVNMPQDIPTPPIDAWRT